MTRRGRTGFQYSPLEFAEALGLRYSSPLPSAALRELPNGVAESVFEVLNLLWLFGTLPDRSGEWLLPKEVRAFEEELLTSALDAGLRFPLAVIVGELAEPREDTATLPKACAAAAEWAFGAEAPDTALAFIELAAIARPGSGRLALVAGRALKSHGRLREAEYWLRRSAKLSQWSRDWEAFVLGQCSLGMLYWSQGGPTRAERHLKRAMRAAREHGIRGELGVVNHELFVVRVTSNRFEEVEALAVAALQHYLPDHPRLPHLAYDLSYYWLMRGYAKRAVPLLKKLVEFFPAPAQRIQVLSALARAAGAIGDRQTFEEAWREAQPLIGHQGIRMTRAAALIDLGLGASHFSRWDDASACFSNAIKAAEDTDQHDTLIRADACLKSVARTENPDTLARPQTVALKQTSSENLASACLSALSTFGSSAYADTPVCLS
jgi:tetratricopeptide (TPR) repeat protein